ncbi:permease [bacterium]|nr:permease [bacterium]
MTDFLPLWHKAAMTSLGFFWMAFWAFALGYLISSLIQVLVTRGQMQKAMGSSGTKAMALGTFFGFVSSSCSFAALSTTRALFAKGAGLAPSMAFMLASTNLVVELGIVIAIFLSWQFVVGEYLGGLLLIGFVWVFIRLTKPTNLIKAVRERLAADGDDEESAASWKQTLTTRAGWQRIGMRYVMEWKMVWKDVLIGFTVAGLIAAFVPDAFFQALFVGSGSDDAPGFWAVLAQAIIGPVAAFFTFIGSMGNIPLAALLFDRGVSFAGVMAFIFSDLVVFPVLRINAEYYGWKMAAYITGMLLVALVAVAVTMHYGFGLFGILPESSASGSGSSTSDRNFWSIDLGFVLNLLFIAMTAALIALWVRQRSPGSGGGKDAPLSLSDWFTRCATAIAAVWLIGGALLALVL